MRVLGLLMTLVLLLSGCQALPRAREMGDMDLLRTMGVDAGESGVAVTASTGPRAQGLQGQEESARSLSAPGGSLTSACLALQSMGENYVFFGYVDQLLLGEELARRDVTSTLDYFARDTELGLGARLWVVRGNTAAAAVESGGETGVDGRLEALQTDGEQGVTALSRTAGEVYADLLEWGAAHAPALSVTEGGGLQPAGYGILKDGVLVGFLEGEALRGLELLVGRPERDVLETDVIGWPAVLEVTGAVTRCRMVGEGVVVNCRVEALLAEQETAPGQTELDELESWLAAREAARLEAALAQLQNWDADCAGVMPRASLTDPAAWRTGQTPEFARAAIRVEVEAEVRP